MLGIAVLVALALGVALVATPLSKRITHDHGLVQLWHGGYRVAKTRYVYDRWTNCLVNTESYDDQTGLPVIFTRRDRKDSLWVEWDVHGDITLVLLNGLDCPKPEWPDWAHDYSSANPPDWFYRDELFSSVEIRSEGEDDDSTESGLAPR